jgi:hypothetical protein
MPGDISNPDRLARLIGRIAELNAKDPNSESVEGASVPRELHYARRLTAWVEQLEPQPSEALLVAAAGQHIERWLSPRASYPMDRVGYLKWRADLKKMHAERVAGLMREEGYSDAEIARVREIILKASLKDPETQTIEDALCLVFLESQFGETLAKTGREKMIEILKKSWAKMSERGRAAALAMPMADSMRAIVAEALG